MQYERFEHWKKKIFLVDMKEDKPIGFFSSLAQHTLEKYIPQGKKILIIGGKKWLAAGVMCQDCGYIPKCQHCDIPIAYHQDHAAKTFGICHICKTAYSAVSNCPSCQGHNVTLFGMGLQKIEKTIADQFPSCAILMIDAEKAASLPKLERLADDIQKAQCIIATSLLQIPPSNRKPDIVIVLRADSMLSIPDWKVAEHCYHMLQNTIAKNDCPIIIQAYTPWHYAINAACKIDDAGFWQEENTYREQYVYPPYGEMAIILYRHEIEETMFTRVNKLYQELLFLQEKDGFAWEIFATPPLIYKMYDKYRYNIVLKGTSLCPFLEKAFVQLKVRERGFKIDWLPENIV